jgi:hypothetical protein
MEVYAVQKRGVTEWEDIVLFPMSSYDTANAFRKALSRTNRSRSFRVHREYVNEIPDSMPEKIAALAVQLTEKLTTLPAAKRRLGVAEAVESRQDSRAKWV